MADLTGSKQVAIALGGYVAARLGSQGGYLHTPPGTAQTAANHI